GRQHHTICPSLSISALTEQLPMRPRLRFRNVPSSCCELRRQPPQPLEEGGGSGGSIGGRGGARADLDGDAVAGVHENEGVLVGDVIAGEHRPPAGERLLFEKIRDGGAL